MKNKYVNLKQKKKTYALRIASLLHISKNQ